ncbi:MAG: diguanylate cyclase [Sandaracinaceae bacterium]
MRVLIADDSPTSRKVLETMLRSWGYEVEAYPDGKTAWEALNADDAPKIAILDWVMPGMDGVDVCRALRQQDSDRHVFVYLLSARGKAKDVLEGLDAGADDYLTKPVNPAELRIRLRNGRRLVEAQSALIEAREALRTLAMTDPGMKIWNRRAFMDIATEELARSARRERPVSLLMLDLDHFKSVNDRYGHRAGDAVLEEVAARMNDALREGDPLGRYGGEELVALLPDCPGAPAYIVAERVRRAVAREPIVFEGAVIPVTTSIGVATRQGTEGIAAVIERADQALYSAKRSGRNRTAISTQRLAATGS